MIQKLEPCSLIKLMFTGEENCAQLSWIEFPEPLASLIFNYKLAFQDLQFTILEDKPNNLKEIGHCFKELERHFHELIHYNHT